eukprot:412829-Pyramimonas_sp.AAC.1
MEHPRGKTARGRPRFGRGRGGGAARRRLEDSAHEVKQDARGRMQCRVCFTKPSPGGRDSWLSSPCIGHPASLRRSHLVWCFKGVFWCRACGGYGTTAFQKLGVQCRPETLTKGASRL